MKKYTATIWIQALKLYERIQRILHLHKWGEPEYVETGLLKGPAPRRWPWSSDVQKNVTVRVFRRVCHTCGKTRYYV